MPKQPVSTAQAEQFLEEAAAMDIEPQIVTRRFGRFGWWVAGTLCLAMVAQAFALVVLANKPEPPPALVRVDEATGSVETLPRVKNPQVTYGELVDKANMANYVRAREGYSYATAGANYTLVGLMSAPSEKQRYYAWFDPKMNRDSPRNMLGESGKIEVKVTSRSFLKSEKAMVGVVRWVAETRRSPTEEASKTYWISTITYRYGKPPEKESDRDLNPLGWQAIDYRKDPDGGIDPIPMTAPRAPEPTAPDQRAGDDGAVRLFPGS